MGFSCGFRGLLDGPRQIGENIAIEEDPVTRTKNPFRRWTPSETNSLADVIRVLIEHSGQALEIVAYTQVKSQLSGERPVILYESADTRHWKIHVRTPERLPKLIRISREEILEGAKEIYATEGVRYVGT